MPAAAVLPARRLALTAAELALLVHKGWLRLPPGFSGTPIAASQLFDTEDSDGADVAGPALRDAARSLADRGVVTGCGSDPVDCEPVRAVVGNLAVLADPQAAVHVEVTGPHRGTRVVYAVAGPLGASLAALADGGAELSVFPAVALGRELVRAVPPAADLRTPEATEIAPALGEPPHPPEPLAGLVPLAALTDPDVLDGRAGVEALGMTRQQAALAARVHAGTVGTLRCLVTGRIADGVTVGQVMWLATRDGWVGLQPEPDGSPRRMVTLRPVAREALGIWLAPHLTQILEAAGER